MMTTEQGWEELFRKRRRNDRIAMWLVIVGCLAMGWMIAGPGIRMAATWLWAVLA